MMNRAHRTEHGAGRAWALSALALCAAMPLHGCKKEEPPPPPPPPPPRVVEAARPVDVQSLMMDERVQFPSQFAPTDRDLAQSVADLASAIARGDEDAAATYFDGAARGALEMLVRSGEWRSATERVRAVRVVRIDGGGDEARVGLAIEDTTGAYLTGWRASNVGGRWMFTGLPVAPRSAARASDLDGADLGDAS